MRLCKLYVNNERFVLRSIKRGWQCLKGEGLLIYDLGFEECNEGLMGHEYFTLVLKQIMNSIREDVIFNTKHMCDFKNKYYT